MEPKQRTITNDIVMRLKTEISKLKKELRRLKPSTIPEGYKWCSECAALTPRDKINYWRYTCMVCDNSEIGDGCPNCGAPAPEIEFESRKVTLHRPGCHFGWEDLEEVDDVQPFLRDFHDSWADRIANEFLEDNFSTWMMNPNSAEFKRRIRIKTEIQKQSCGCPKVIIYPQPFIFNYKSHYVFSMDCSNAMEWSYDVRCPICGEVYEVSDGNC